MYSYRIERGTAVLNRGDDAPLKKIGTFKTDAEAKAACQAHYAKACKALANLGKPVPAISFF
jgi:hypothetical protein